MLKRMMLFAAAIASAIAIAPVAQSENMFSGGRAKPNTFWWPEQLDLEQLRSHDARSNPSTTPGPSAASTSRN